MISDGFYTEGTIPRQSRGKGGKEIDTFPWITGAKLSADKMPYHGHLIPWLHVTIGLDYVWQFSIHCMKNHKCSKLWMN